MAGRYASDAKRRGTDAEELARRYLLRRGMQCIGRNYRCRRGEIDLIMLHGGSLVFVEVRYRRYTMFGSAAESIDSRKQRKIIACAQRYLQDNPSLSRFPGRFDVVCIRPGAAGTTIQWIADAFQIQG